MDQTEAAIRAQILGADPDFVLFQELPGLIPYIETYGMVPANTRGQTGDIAILARHSLLEDISAKAAPNAVLATINSAQFTIASVHLPSGRSGDFDRLSAIKELRNEAPTQALAIIGDTNTRTAEEDDIAKLGLLGERPPEPTWNGRINPFRHGAREYTAYFTRAFHTDDLILSEQKVWTTNTHHKSHNFHLSDHFALSGRIEKMQDISKA